MSMIRHADPPAPGGRTPGDRRGRSAKGLRRLARRARDRRGLPRRMATPALVAAAGMGMLMGCDQVSEETRNAGTAVLCSRIQVDPGDIERNPETARVVALLVRDLGPDGNIRDLAQRVADDPTAISPRAQLADWVNDRCGNAGGTGIGSSGGGGGSAGDAGDAGDAEGGAGGGEQEGDESE